MLRSMKNFGDFGLRATDGEIGSVQEFYFDDKSWTIRYLVLKTHKWLPGRVVLISPSSLGTPDWERKVIPVSLTKSQIEQSPLLDDHRPITRKNEEELRKYYGWTDYWNNVDLNLQSSNDVMSFKISARDGALGKVADFILDDTNWRIRYMVVDTNEWLPSKKVLLSLDWIDQIVPEGKKVRVDLLRKQIEKAPEYDEKTIVSRDYEVSLYGYYGKPIYWDLKG